MFYMWVPAHEEIKGTEIADHTAKRGTIWRNKILILIIMTIIVYLGFLPQYLF